MPKDQLSRLRTEPAPNPRPGCAVTGRASISAPWPACKPALPPGSSFRRRSALAEGASAAAFVAASILRRPVSSFSPARQTRFADFPGTEEIGRGVTIQPKLEDILGLGTEQDHLLNLVVFGLVRQRRVAPNLASAINVAGRMIVTSSGRIPASR